VFSLYAVSCLIHGLGFLFTARLSSRTPLHFIALRDAECPTEGEAETGLCNSAQAIWRENNQKSPTNARRTITKNTTPNHTISRAALAAVDCRGGGITSAAPQPRICLRADEINLCWTLPRTKPPPNHIGWLPAVAASTQRRALEYDGRKRHGITRKPGVRINFIESELVDDTVRV